MLFPIFAAWDMGRPKADKEKLRSVNFTIRLTGSEIKQLDLTADACGTTTSELVREKLFNGTFPKAKTGTEHLS